MVWARYDVAIPDVVVTLRKTAFAFLPFYVVHARARCDYRFSWFSSGQGMGLIIGSTFFARVLIRAWRHAARQNGW